MAARSKARKRAVDILFEADQRGLDAVALLTERRTAPSDVKTPEGEWESDIPDAPEIREYTVELVEGVVERQERIDELLSTYARDWTLDRMPAVDRAVLRLGTWELLYNDDVPDAVAIDEAVELARTLSTDDSPGFVNGLLARLLDVKRV